jgi:pimeloyl-ACP methyl ester carboxylesterase
MQNTDHSRSHGLSDKLISRAVNSLSYVIGVKNITRPFWNRWRSSLLDDATIMEFLNSIDTIDQWPVQAVKVVERESAALERDLRAGLAPGEQIARLRRISYLAHMAQWGIIPIDRQKTECYRLSRDLYAQAEQLAHGDRYLRVAVPWKHAHCYGNLHLPQGAPPYPLVVIIHGMDDSKEEHLGHELALQAAGFAVLGLDGPGQAESLLLEELHWEHDFHEAVSLAIDTVAQYGCDPREVGVCGISWGGLWAFKLAATDPRIRAVYDLGGPIDTTGFRRLPWFLKSKFCQVLGVDDPAAASAELVARFCLHEGELERIDCRAARIVHGARDPLVPIADKLRLHDELRRLHPALQVSLVRYADGDHCCTQHIEEIRSDATEFFVTHLRDVAARAQPVASQLEQLGQN